MKTRGWLMALALCACDGQAADGDAPTDTGWRGRHADTLRFGAADNSEIVKLLPGGGRAVLVGSKARKVTLLAIEGGALVERRSRNLFPEDASESELTHIDFDRQGRFAVVTRTKPVSEGGTLVDCRGSLVFLDVSDGELFGTVLREVEVGPMPDAVDVSDDDRWVVSADEVDFNEGKCPLPDLKAQVTLLELPGGDPAAATVRARITMTGGEGAKREPEQIVFASDGDHVAATLQDTHEVLLFRRSALLDGATGVVERTSDDVTVVRLPDRPDGAEPWPDGVHRVVDAAGAEHFVVAGEYNDTLHVLALDGTHEAQVLIDPADMPGDLPRNVEPGSFAPFRPDSLAAFRWQGHAYVAASLKHAGAVGVWRFDDVADVRIAGVVKVGAADEGTANTESTIGMEGISAADGVVVTANEAESSVSLVLPL